MLGEDKTTLVQPPFHFSQCQSKNQLCADFEWTVFEGVFVALLLSLTQNLNLVLWPHIISSTNAVP